MTTKQTAVTIALMILGCDQGKDTRLDSDNAKASQQDRVHQEHIQQERIEVCAAVKVATIGFDVTRMATKVDMSQLPAGEFLTDAMRKDLAANLSGIQDNIRDEQDILFNRLRKDIEAQGKEFYTVDECSDVSFAKIPPQVRTDICDLVREQSTDIVWVDRLDDAFSNVDWDMEKACGVSNPCRNVTAAEVAKLARNQATLDERARRLSLTPAQYESCLETYDDCSADTISIFDKALGNIDDVDTLARRERSKRSSSQWEELVGCMALDVARYIDQQSELFRTCMANRKTIVVDGGPAGVITEKTSCTGYETGGGNRRVVLRAFASLQ